MSRAPLKLRLTRVAREATLREEALLDRVVLALRQQGATNAEMVNVLIYLLSDFAARSGDPARVCEIISASLRDNADCFVRRDSPGDKHGPS